MTASHTSPTGSTRPGALPRESALARLWASQPRLDLALRTADGRAVAVITPGRPGGRRGPDFVDAVVRFDDEQPVTGDVELHRRASGFLEHGHATDHAYDRVVLHVVFDAEDARMTALASGRQAPIVVLPAPAGDPAHPRREPCAAAVQRLGIEGVRAVLRDAGLWRLRQKAAVLMPSIEREGEAQTLYAALATALGQTANARPMALLAERLPLATLLAPACEPPVDVSVAGRAPVIERDRGSRPAEPSRSTPPSSPVTHAIPAPEHALLHAAGLDGALLTPAPALPWVVRGQRPAAAPARRLLALARLVARFAQPDLAAGVRALLGSVTAANGGVLLQALVVEATDGGPAPCGRDRAVELAVNAVLPWAAACHLLTADDASATATLALAASLPAAGPYGVTAHLTANLRDGRGRTLVNSALAQQGALAMLGAWCRRGGCGRCPLS